MIRLGIDLVRDLPRLRRAAVRPAGERPTPATPGRGRGSQEGLEPIAGRRTPTASTGCRPAHSKRISSGQAAGRGSPGGQGNLRVPQPLARHFQNTAVRTDPSLLFSPSPSRELGHSPICGSAGQTSSTSTDCLSRLRERSKLAKRDRVSSRLGLAERAALPQENGRSLPILKPWFPGLRPLALTRRRKRLRPLPQAGEAIGVHPRDV